MCYIPTIPLISSSIPKDYMNYFNFAIIGETFLYFLILQFLYFFLNLGNNTYKYTFFPKPVSISNIELSKIEQKCQELLTQKKVYLDENLDILNFSQQSGYSYKVISQYLNSEKKIRFDDLIADYRVNEAKIIMKTRPELNSMQVGFESGFNSTSSFYRLFKKKTGKSPDSYRKQLKK